MTTIMKAHAFAKLVASIVFLVATISPASSACFDKAALKTCQSYKSNGYCDPRSAYYKTARYHCEQTCGVCGCTDVQLKSHCTSWEKLGFCTDGLWKAFMRQYCGGTCAVCSPVPSPPSTITTVKPTLPSTCKDENDYCYSYKDYCTDPNYVSFVQVSCKKTCNYCHITTTPKPTTVPVVTKPYIVEGGSERLQPGCGRKGPAHTRIVGGRSADPGEWPWQVTFDYKHNTVNPGHHCGGTLITDEWILSAAHCFADDRDKKNYWLTIGDHDLSVPEPSEQRIPIDQMIFHPNYSSIANHDYDLILIKLAAKARIDSRASAACLPDHNTTFKTGDKCFITGWGLLKEFGKRPKILQEAMVPLADHGACQKAFDPLAYVVTPRMFCAGHSTGGIDSCEGDSGGPMVCQAPNGLWYLWGVISWGVGCARAAYFGVYANTKMLRPWVDSIVFPTAGTSV